MLENVYLENTVTSKVLLIIDCTLYVDIIFPGNNDKYGKRQRPFGKLLLTHNACIKQLSATENIFLKNIKSVEIHK